MQELTLKAEDLHVEYGVLSARREGELLGRFPSLKMRLQI